MSDKSHGPENPLTQLWIAMSGASAGHHEAAPGIDDKSVAVGHEPDRFGLGGIVAVPVAVFVALVVTYVTVTLVFRFVNDSASDAVASKDVPLNDRLGRIGSTGGQAVPSLPGQPSGEPRLDGTPKIDTRVNGKDVAPYLMSFRKTPSGNWPDLYPEDLRPENYVDYDTQRRPLVDPAEAHAGNKAFARIPVADASQLLWRDHAAQQLKVRQLRLQAAELEQRKNAADADELKKLNDKIEAIAAAPEYQYYERFVPVSDTPLDPTKSVNRPKPSSGGQAAKGQPATAKPKGH